LDARPQLDFTLTDPYLSLNANSNTSRDRYIHGRTPSEPNVPTVSMLGVGVRAGGGSKSWRGTVSSSHWPPALLISALPEVSLRGSPLCPCGEASFERLLKQGYRGDSPIALEWYAVLRRAIFSETNQLPTCAHEIKKLNNIQRLTDDIPEDALPSSEKMPATLTLQCAWAEYNHSCSRPEDPRLHSYRL